MKVRIDSECPGTTWQQIWPASSEVGTIELFWDVGQQFNGEFESMTNCVPHFEQTNGMSFPMQRSKSAWFGWYA